MKKFLQVAVRAARESGRIQMEHRHRVGGVRLKGEINLVTEVDLLCEKTIKEIIMGEYPAHSFLGEEGGEALGEKSAYKWIVDPLDGTTNYAHGFPMYCTSIALEVEGEIILGVVLDPTRNELFTACRGGGAFLNEEKISVTRRENLIECLLATGFAYDVQKTEVDNIRHFTNFIKNARGVRRPGSAALDLCYVAAGRFDGYWEMKLKPWDSAAGFLLVKEAGGKVTVFNGEPYSVYAPEIVASNGVVHGQMIRILTGS